MGSLQSSKVAAGMKVLADHFNRLWEDLTTNHDHSSGKGGTVAHSDLSSVGTKTHTEIDTHITGTGDLTDNPGGTKGVHGLAAGTFVSGALGDTQLCFFSGRKVVDITSNATISTATCYFSPTGANPATVTFSSAPLVFCQLEGSSGSESGWHMKDGIDIRTIGTGSFEYTIMHARGSTTAIHFLAVGAKS